MNCFQKNEHQKPSPPNPDPVVPKLTTIPLKTRTDSKLRTTITNTNLETPPRNSPAPQVEIDNDSDFEVDNVNQELDTYQKIYRIDRTQNIVED